MNELAIKWLLDNAPAFVKAAIDAQEDALRAENGRLRDALWIIIDLHPDASKMVLHAGETLERLKPSPAAKV